MVTMHLCSYGCTWEVATNSNWFRLIIIVNQLFVGYNHLIRDQFMFMGYHHLIINQLFVG